MGWNGSGCGSVIRSSHICCSGSCWDDDLFEWGVGVLRYRTLEGETSRIGMKVVEACKS